ncbi:TIGR02530 family flagellar biosynthesis protein [Paenibacillus aurantius]|uniref:TIGR02530 family flagellar biosynthesis protein n=1 Tax=Paenibacillus aurantius TaxID=2918900 RepID=A0AA96RHT5_9BACL|nr:TIGR02530 family flagellar biosynthesis protein [Paenibacillus aurantius]WJH33272.1 flagellar biosynthesis protein [Paenibacillus sp. CC-CFT747]WNQ13738.1 TIGR02530 family flagellar biosynthesis protein [Paenibacillus aurantius]
MTGRISIGQLYPHPPKPGIQPKQTASSSGRSDNPTSFDKLLSSQMKLSHHAEVRLQQRGIQLQPEQLTKIQSAIDKAAAKGAKDSLVLMNDMALIVNVPNRTIVTALDGATMKDNVFTQIDSAIVVS